MHLQELKSKSPADLLKYAEELEIENASTLRKQDILFSVLKFILNFCQYIFIIEPHVIISHLYNYQILKNF